MTAYNSLIKLRNLVSEAFATMDVYLKKRWDLIPNLVEVVKGYASHESGLLESVTALRNAAYDTMSSADKINANEQISAGITRLLALAENYPDLKASQNFADLSAELAKVEGEVAQSRKYYNAVVRELNTKTEVFPSNLVAGFFHIAQARMFEAQAEERANVKVELS